MDVIGFAYAAVVAVGGVMGYIKAGSVMSLSAGLIFGAMSALGASQTSKDPSNCYLILSSALTLACMMGYRFFSSGKFMPAGFVTVISVPIVIRYGMRYLRKRQVSSTEEMSTLPGDSRSLRSPPKIQV